MRNSVAIISIDTFQQEKDFIYIEGESIGRLDGAYLTYDIPLNSTLSLALQINKIETLDDGRVRLITYCDEEGIDFISTFDISGETLEIFKQPDHETFMQFALMK